MTFGKTHQALDDLTYFEEQLVSPIQPVVRIFTLYGTGLTEARGHVANWVQNGPEYVRAIPLKAGDAKVLLVRRFPKDPNRKQRVPFVVSRTRLEAALNQLTLPEAQGGHRAFQQDRLVRHGLVPISRENLEEYDPDGSEPTGLQVSVVEQGGKFVLDKPLLGKWLGEHLKLQLNGQVFCVLSSAMQDVLPAEKQEAPEELLWEEKAWPVLLQLVRQAVSERTARAEQERQQSLDAGLEPEGLPDLEPVPSKDAMILTDTALATWMGPWVRVEAWEGQCDVLAVLRDELTIVQELEVLEQQPVEHSGTWEPDSNDAKISEEELIADYWNELVQEHGDDGQKKREDRDAQLAHEAQTDQDDLDQQEEGAQEPFDTSNMDRREQAIWDRFEAARVKKAPKLDPPSLEDTRRMVREDTPWYITAAFPKVFQTGEGDYWAYHKERTARGLPVSLLEWVQHVLRGRDGRALRHPRFFYFAVNTLLRNKAVRGKSYFIKSAFGDQAHSDYTPQELLRMGKSGMTRVLCAYETNLPGSAAEKLSQRADLESMLNQLEEEGLNKATAAMPKRHQVLEESTRAMAEWQRQFGNLEASAPDEVAQGALQEALQEQGKWPPANGLASQAQVPHPTENEKVSDAGRDRDGDEGMF